LETSIQRSPVIRLPFESYAVHIGVAAALVHVGQLQDALSIAKGIKVQKARDNTYAEISLELAQAGRVQEAEDAAKQIKDDVRKSAALSAIVVRLAEDDRGQQAKQLLPAIRFPDDMSRARAAVAQWQIKHESLYAAANTARLCESSKDQLEVYQETLRAYAKRRSPALKRRLDEVEAASASKNADTTGDPYLKYLR
jgi:hypothetical protein